MSAATALRDSLARTMGEGAAASWMHSLAVVRHAVQTGRLDAAVLAADAPPVVIAERAVRALAAAHSGLAAFADPAVNRAWTHQLTAYEAAELLAWVRGIDMVPAPERPDGYALGDLYQELSTEARKGRALCQTPRFVTGLLLDLGFDQAAAEFGWNGLRMIDPACGTGHILIEAFVRTWVGRRSGLRPTSRSAPGPGHGESWLQQVRSALAVVHGVDLDPYAALVARYRLAAMAAAMLQVGALADLPADLPLQVAAADSLLDEDEPLLARGRYHVVVANPPYITCKDATQNATIRARWRQVCNGKFGLFVPFEPLMHELAVPGGWVIRITANSFMKREFGRALIAYLATVDLQWLIDTSGACIPGHGTPTVIMVSRAQAPSSDLVTRVEGIRGEPGVPADPARGVVWTAIARSVRERLAFARLARALGEEPVPAPPEPAPEPLPVAYVQPSLFDLMGAAS